MMMLLLFLFSASAPLVVLAFGFCYEIRMKPAQIRSPFQHQGLKTTIKTLQRYFSPVADGDEVADENIDVGAEFPVVAVNGTTEDFVVTKQYHVPIEGFTNANDGDFLRATSLTAHFSPEDISRLQLKSNNVTLAVALMLLDPAKYPTQSRARKAIR